MSTLSQFMPGGKPKSVTVYTSGSGTYTPFAPNSWCYVRLIGAGGPGGGAIQCCYSGPFRSSPGSHGYILERWTQVVTTAAYSVGAGATWSNYVGPHDSYPIVTTAGATTFNGLSSAGGEHLGGYNPTSYETMIRDMMRNGAPGVHGGNANGRGGASTGGQCNCQNNCCGYNPYFGTNSANGYILIQDFGP